MAKKADELKWTKYVELVALMSHDVLLGCGPTKAAYVSNLRMIANQMKTLLPNKEIKTKDDAGA